VQLRCGLEITPGGTLLGQFSDEAVRRIHANVGRNNVSLYSLFVRSYVALLLDSPVDEGKPRRLINRFVEDLINTPAKSLILRYASLADSIISSFNGSSDFTITGDFVDGMKDTPIFREYLHFFNTSDSRCLKFILSFLWFGKKMDYIDPNLESDAFRDWLTIESEMEAFQINDQVLTDLRTIVSQLLGDFQDDIFLPKHGPGYTAEGFIDPNEKLDHISFDRKALYAFRESSFGRVPIDRMRLDTLECRRDVNQVAKLRFVPKTVKSMRSICMEPIGRMYLQKEVERWLKRSMDHGVISQFVTLSDQELNRYYAYHGSYSGSCDTIDLSAASDRVHVDLVRRVFPKKILFYLLGTRTDKVNTPSGQISLKKFAPMGSALCFPVQTILFTSIVLYGYMKHNAQCSDDERNSKLDYLVHHVRSFARGMHDDPSQILYEYLAPRIYGDDIICDYRITNNVLFLLAQCGLKVNVSKSFIGNSLFRESCGIFAYNGEDVTPLLFRVPSLYRGYNASIFGSFIDQINNAGDHHYRHLHSYWINELKTWTIEGIKCRNFIPFTSHRYAFGIYTNHERVCNTTRSSSRYQCDEKRVMVIKARSTKGAHISPLMEEYAYDQWMRARVRGGSEEINFSSSRTRPRASRVSLEWLPVR